MRSAAQTSPVVSFNDQLLNLGGVRGVNMDDDIFRDAGVGNNISSGIHDDTVWSQTPQFKRHMSLTSSCGNGGGNDIEEWN